MKYLRPNEYCEIFRISKPTFYRHAKSGIIKTIKIGRKYLIPIEEEEKKSSNEEKAKTVKKEKAHIRVKSKFEKSLDLISPEIIKTIADPPEFGSIKIKITYHAGKPVKTECGKCITRQVSHKR